MRLTMTYLKAFRARALRGSRVRPRAQSERPSRSRRPRRRQRQARRRHRRRLSRLQLGSGGLFDRSGIGGQELHSREPDDTGQEHDSGNKKKCDSDIGVAADKSDRRKREEIAEDVNDKDI